MGAAVDPSELRTVVGRYGRLATVVTVSDALQPHVGTSMVDFDDEALVIRVGQRTAGYLAERPEFALCWSPPLGDDYQLILDLAVTDVRPDGDLVRVEASVRSGILHRVAGAPARGRTCIAISDDA